MDNPILDILGARKAGRSISGERLPDEVVQDLMEAIRMTPSCFNKQPWRYLFLESEDGLAKGHQILSKGNLPWASRAPLLVIAYAKRGDDCELPDGRAYYQFDVGMSAMDMMLCATHHGLVARPMAGWDSAKVKELFGLEAEDEPIVVIAVGKPSDDESHLADHYKGLDKKPRVRKDVSEIVRRL
jgi:nitroreductase